MNDQIELLSATECNSNKDSKMHLDFSGLSKLSSGGCNNREYKFSTGIIPIERIKGGIVRE